MGLGPGTGSPPSAISTPVFLNPQAAGLRLVFFDVRACTTLGKTATATNKPNVASVPQTLVFDILHLLEGISEVGAADTSTVLDPTPRVGGKRGAANFVRSLVGIPTKTRNLAMYQSV